MLHLCKLYSYYEPKPPSCSMHNSYKVMRGDKGLHIVHLVHPVSLRFFIPKLYCYYTSVLKKDNKRCSSYSQQNTNSNWKWNLNLSVIWFNLFDFANKYVSMHSLSFLWKLNYFCRYEQHTFWVTTSTCYATSTCTFHSVYTGISEISVSLIMSYVWKFLQFTDLTQPRSKSK